MRRADGFDRAQPDETADAVIAVHDDVAGRQRRDLRYEISRAPLARPSHQAVAEDVLFRDDHEAVGLEPGFERQDREGHGLRGKLAEFVERGNRGRVAELVLRQDLAQPVE